MKVVILAGGYGTRISEESQNKPKPMIELGGYPILWHIMKTYSHYGYNEFVICAGYKQYAIKEYFANYFLHCSDVTFDFTASNKMTVHSEHAEPWKVTVVDSGLDTMTGGRVKRIQPYIGDEPFMLTYGDGVADVDINKLVEFHKEHGHIATMTAVSVGQRFGCLGIEDDITIPSFREKSDMTAAASMRALWCLNLRFSILSRVIQQYLKKLLLKQLLLWASLTHIFITVFVSLWILLERRCSLKKCGQTALLRGRFGKKYGFIIL